MRAHPLSQRTCNSYARMCAYDRRLSAIHEAGHALVALRLGCEISVQIYETGTDKHLSERLWGGNMSAWGLPDERSNPDLMRVAVAGLVAETLWKDGHIDDYSESWAWEDKLHEMDSMSQTDWELAGCEPGNPNDALVDVAADTAVFLMRNWAALLDLSRTLMRDKACELSFQRLLQAKQALA